MRTTILAKTVGVVLVSLAATSAAIAEVNVRLRAGAGMGIYSVTSNLLTGGRLVEYDADYVAVPFGVTLIMNNEFYVDLLHQTASGDAKFDWSGQKPDFARDDTTLTLGARKGEFSIYVAYKTGETKTDWPTGFDPDKLTASGFLAGFGWAKPFGSSALTLGAGVGVMSGKYAFATTSNPFESDTTIGFSVGAGYTYAFNSNFSLNADLKWQTYNYDFGPFYIEENPSHLTLNLQYTF
jgi:opacity protein-like surface antigen